MLQASQHNEIDELLSCNKSVDLLIPRGSNAFVQYIMNNTKIPVMGHADGICHTYIDKDADLDKAIPIIIDARHSILPPAMQQKLFSYTGMLQMKCCQPSQKPSRSTA